MNDIADPLPRLRRYTKAELIEFANQTMRRQGHLTQLGAVAQVTDSDVRAWEDSQVEPVGVLPAIQGPQSEVTMRIETVNSPDPNILGPGEGENRI